MDLIPVESSTDREATPTRVSLTERAKTLARIRTAEATRLGSGGTQRRLLGRVDYDETSLRTVTAWIGGRIERLHVSTTGERVRRGQTIATLYSPEVYNSHQDLIQARQQLERLQQAATPSARRSAEAALDAARDRLRLLGVPAAEVRAMERADKPSERVRIRTPFGGTVIERLATQGSYVQTGTGLYRVADLSTLWVQLDAYESDLPVLKTGQEVILRVEALPGERSVGRVTFVDPVLDPKTRTARVRIEVENEDRRLRPGTFVEAIVRSDPEQGPVDDAPIVIPATAPLFTGRRSVVYVEVDGADAPTYEARVVTLGTRLDDRYPVLEGLAEGERVVVHGAFAIDADLQIQGGASMMHQSNPSADTPPTDGHSHHHGEHQHD
jgi:Cu(I)/Ag(I) efflux system membrane fusion protein